MNLLVLMTVEKFIFAPRADMIDGLTRAFKTLNSCSVMRPHSLGIHAEIIDEVIEDSHCFVQMELDLAVNAWLTG